MAKGLTDLIKLNIWNLGGFLDYLGRHDKIKKVLTRGKVDMKSRIIERFKEATLLVKMEKGA